MADDVHGPDEIEGEPAEPVGESGDASTDEPEPRPGGEPEDPERRTFLIRTINVIGAGIATAIGIPAVVYVTGSARAAGEFDEWIRLGSTGSVEPGAPPILMKATVSRRTGYLVEEQEISVFVTTDGAEYTLLSNVCTHLGCRVRWVDDQDGFFCPCHNAVFGPDGEVIAGPPPRPLDRFDYKVEEGQLYFRET
jgi:Rieske Fe-S protein